MALWPREFSLSGPFVSEHRYGRPFQDASSVYNRSRRFFGRAGPLEQPGTLIEGKYEILARIREGGMGSIYNSAPNAIKANVTQRPSEAGGGTGQDLSVKVRCPAGAGLATCPTGPPRGETR